MDGLNQKTTDREKLQVELGEPGPERIWYVGDAFAQGFTLDEVHNITHIDPWFLSQIKGNRRHRTGARAEDAVRPGLRHPVGN